MSPLSFFIPGAPRGKGRPKFSTRGGVVRTYTDEQTASYENLVALAAKAALAGRPPFTCPLSLYMRADIAPPKSVSQKQRAAMLAGEIEPAKKPDLDNILKAVLDGLNTVAFTDDALVTHIHAAKVYSDHPGVQVTLTPSKDA